MNIEVELRSFISEEKYNELIDFFRTNAKFVKEDFQETHYFDVEQDLRIQKNPHPQSHQRIVEMSGSQKTILSHAVAAFAFAVMKEPEIYPAACASQLRPVLLFSEFSISPLQSPLSPGISS